MESEFDILSIFQPLQKDAATQTNRDDSGTPPSTQASSSGHTVMGTTHDMGTTRELVKENAFLRTLVASLQKEKMEKQERKQKRKEKKKKKLTTRSSD